MAPPPAAAGTAARCGLVGTCAAVAVVLQSLLVAEAGAALRTRDATNNMAPFEQVLPVLSGEQSFADAQLRLRSLRASGYRGRITIELHDTVHRGPPVELGLVDSGFDADGPTVLRGGREGAEGRASFDPGLCVMNWVKNAAAFGTRCCQRVRTRGSCGSTAGVLPVLMPTLRRAVAVPILDRIRVAVCSVATL